MPILDNITSSSPGHSNTTITETRSTVTRNLNKFVSGALPKTNRIPGPLGGFAEDMTGQRTTRQGDGVSQTFDAVGVPIDTPVRETNPRVYQNAVTASQNMWQNVESGQMKVGDIVSQTQEPMTLLKYTHDTLPKSSSAQKHKSVEHSNRPAPYAMDLFRLAPKHKFLFVVEFVFNGGYDFVGAGQRSKNDFAIVIKEFDKPKVKYEYEDNVNYYNFRTPVIKRVIHDPLTIKFLDDRQNLAMSFFHEYMKATHPITAVEAGSAGFYESNGMNFGSPINSSSTGVLDGDLVNILKEIKVYHLYDFGAMMNVHHFTNPKITSIEHDSWSMSDSEGSNINAQFVYDGWTMELGIKVNAENSSLIGTLSNAGHYQLNPLQTPANRTTPKTKLTTDTQSTRNLAASLSPGEEVVNASQLEAEAAARNASINGG